MTKTEPKRKATITTTSEIEQPDDHTVLLVDEIAIKLLRASGLRLSLFMTKSSTCIDSICRWNMLIIWGFVVL
mgnify:CR=1 FL=1